ncbi:MAG: IS3 family transposase [Psychromonas sp.]
MSDINIARGHGAALSKCCHIIGINSSTYIRWHKAGQVIDDQRSTAQRPVPINKLSAEEKQTILEVCCQKEYADLPPTQIVPLLLDKGIWHGSESTYYRILRQENMLTHRGVSAQAIKRNVPRLKASKPNDIWCWDVSLLKTHVIGQFFYLHLFLDLYSRKIILAEVLLSESADNASMLTKQAVAREKALSSQVPRVLHSDNGGPMRSATLQGTLQTLGISRSFNRPYTSNDNAFAESIFKTLKYCPKYPASGFKTLEDAQTWVMLFTRWYNGEHLHSGLNFVTPNQRHNGGDKAQLRKRKMVIELAKSKRPERWSGKTRNCDPVGDVYINKPSAEEVKLAA